MPTIFTREPVLWIALVQAAVALVLRLVFDLSVDEFMAALLPLLLGGEAVKRSKVTPVADPKQ